MPHRDLTKELRKRAVWERAQRAAGSFEGLEARIDDFGALMHWEEYGNTASPYGWQIEHIIDIEDGGADTFANLRALNCGHEIGRAPQAKPRDLAESAV